MPARSSDTQLPEERLRLGDELRAQTASSPNSMFPSVAEAVYEQLWRRIVNREFAPGDRLIEDTLAQELGTSRTPVREALLRLGQTGLVKVSARRGFSVPVITAEDVEQLYDLRSALETYAARRATSLISDEDIKHHRSLQESVLGGSSSQNAAVAEAFFRADLALHLLLHNLVGNPRSTRILSDVMGQLSLLSIRAATDPAGNQAAIEEHHAILDALASRDDDLAARTMEAHIEAVKCRSLKDLKDGLE